MRFSLNLSLGLVLLSTAIAGCGSSGNTPSSSSHGSGSLATNAQSASGVTPEGCTQMSPDLTRTSADLRAFAARTASADARDTVIGDLEAVKGDFSDIRDNALSHADKQEASAAITTVEQVQHAVFAVSDGTPGAADQLTRAAQRMGQINPPNVCSGG